MTSRNLSDIGAINDALVEIWREHADGIKGGLSWQDETKPFKTHTMELRCPLQYPKLDVGGIVFVGFNPSFSQKGWANVLKKARAKGDAPKGDGEYLIKAFDADCSDASLKNVAKLEELAHDHLDFFKFHRLASAKLEPHWTHLDLFAWRHTNQSEAKHLLVDEETANKPFAKAQLEVFDALLKLAKPRAVVITNATASRVYLAHRKIKETFNASKGHYLDTIDGVGPVPVLPAGMLTGQRALDVYSRQRLLWQLGQVLKPAIDWDPGTEKPPKNVDD
jgi:hypothetical protein